MWPLPENNRLTLCLVFVTGFIKQQLYSAIRSKSLSHDVKCKRYIMMMYIQQKTTTAQPNVKCTRGNEKYCTIMKSRPSSELELNGLLGGLRFIQSASSHDCTTFLKRIEGFEM